MLFVPDLSSLSIHQTHLHSFHRRSLLILANAMPRLLKHRDDLDLDANHSQWVRDVTTGMLVLAVIFVSFRFLARWLKGLKVGLDDWLLLAALVSAIAY